MKHSYQTFTCNDVLVFLSSPACMAGIAIVPDVQLGGPGSYAMLYQLPCFRSASPQQYVRLDI
jgi:hypothetical protein